MDPLSIMDIQKINPLTGGNSNTAIAYNFGIKHFHAFLEFSITPDSARKITRADCIAYRDHLTAAGKSPSTIALRLAGITKYFDSLIDSGVITANPMRAVKRPKTPAFSQTSELTYDETGALIAAARSHPQPLIAARDYAVLCIGILCGLRRSEFCQITIDSIITTEIDRVKSYKLRLNAKGGPQEAQIDQRAFLALAECIRLYELSYGKLPDDQPVFRGFPKNGVGAAKPLSDKSFNDIIKRLALKAKLDPKKIHAHTLRHTCCTRLFDAGGDDDTIMDIMRHKQITTTKRYHHRHDQTRKAVDLIRRIAI